MEITKMTPIIDHVEILEMVAAGMCGAPGNLLNPKRLAEWPQVGIACQRAAEEIKELREKVKDLRERIGGGCV